MVFLQGAAQKEGRRGGKGGGEEDWGYIMLYIIYGVLYMHMSLLHGASPLIPAILADPKRSR